MAGNPAGAAAGAAVAGARRTSAATAMAAGVSRSEREDGFMPGPIVLGLALEAAQATTFARWREPPGPGLARWARRSHSPAHALADHRCHGRHLDRRRRAVGVPRIAGAVLRAGGLPGPGGGEGTSAEARDPVALRVRAELHG